MHLYLHIPFCESKCFYCAFTSLRADESVKKAYFDALLLDLKTHFTALQVKPKSVKTLFIGGGTPSVVNFSLYEPLFEFLIPFLSDTAECTSEANPHSSNFEWLTKMKNFGINRISFGAQSFNAQKLAFLGRIHNAKDIFQSVENANLAGFDNINVDMIYDTKFDDKKMLDFELENLANLKEFGLTHISAYHLTIEPKTAFWGRTNFKKNAPNLMRHFVRGTENLGFTQYEVSNFGRICQHNLSYWQGEKYLGCGFGAVSFYDNARFYTHKSLKRYINEPNFRGVEHLSQKDLLLEHLFLGFRSCVGIDERKLNPAQRQKAQILVQSKKLIYRDKRFFNPNFMLSDELALFLSEWAKFLAT